MSIVEEVPLTNRPMRNGAMGWTKEEDQLWDAARDGKDDEIERLIDSGTRVDCAHPGRSDTTPLMTAARYANLSSVKLLVRYGADVNMKSRWGRTALDDARKYNKQPRIMDKRNVVAFLEDVDQVAAEREKGVAEKEAKAEARKTGGGSEGGGLQAREGGRRDGTRGWRQAKMPNTATSRHQREEGSGEDGGDDREHSS